MPRIKLILEYDGTDFVGWQVQPNGRSVQAVVEEALSRLLDAKVAVEVAGRTDAGVHALGQVAAFTTARALPLKAYARGLNGLLPPDVAVVRAEEVAADFDPRRLASGKRYRYRISTRGQRAPLRRRTHWELFGALDEAAMRQAGQGLLGQHDFSAFRASDCEARTAVRRIREVTVAGGEDQLSIEVEGTAFLKHMVRNIVGTLVEVGRGKQPAAWVAEVLASRDRGQAGQTAPPQGLCLVEVQYAARSTDGGEELA